MGFIRPGPGYNALLNPPLAGHAYTSFSNHCQPIKSCFRAANFYTTFQKALILSKKALFLKKKYQVSEHRKLLPKPFETDLIAYFSLRA